MDKKKSINPPDNGGNNNNDHMITTQNTFDTENTGQITKRSTASMVFDDDDAQTMNTEITAPIIVSTQSLSHVTTDSQYSINMNQHGTHQPNISSASNLYHINYNSNNKPLNYPTNMPYKMPK